MSGKKGLNYQVLITKGSETEALLYDKDGTFLKKLSGAKSDMNNKSKNDDSKKY